MHYLIDLDNVLLDTFYQDENGQTHFYWSTDFEKDFGKHPSILRDLFQPDFLLEMHRTTQLNEYIKPWIEKHGLQISVDNFLTYWLERDSNLNQKMWQWILTEHGKGHHFHIASNQPIVRMDYIWRKFDEWPHVFEEVFTPFYLKTAKPDPNFFHRVQQKLGVGFDDICLIDDSIENIVSARSLGIKTILFPNDFK